MSLYFSVLENSSCVHLCWLAVIPEKRESVNFRTESNSLGAKTWSCSKREQTVPKGIVRSPNEMFRVNKSGSPTR